MYLLMTLKSDGKQLATALPNVQTAWIASLIMQRDATCVITDEPPLDLTVGDFVPGSFITLGNLSRQEKQNA